MQRGNARIVVWCWASLLLAGCGLGADAADQTARAPAAATTASTPPPPAGPAGTPDPDALSAFHCQPDSTGSWSASGTVTNDAGAPAGYLVTVVLAGPEDVAARGQQHWVPDLPGGGTYDLHLRGLPAPPAPTADLTCQAQVLRR